MLIWVQVEFCIDTWATGEFNSKLRFEEQVYRDRYNAHLSQLQVWEGVAPELVQKLRKKMFKRIL